MFTEMASSSPGAFVSRIDSIWKIVDETKTMRSSFRSWMQKTEIQKFAHSLITSLFPKVIKTLELFVTHGVVCDNNISKVWKVFEVAIKDADPVVRRVAFGAFDGFVLRHQKLLVEQMYFCQIIENLLQVLKIYGEDSANRSSSDDARILFRVSRIFESIPKRYATNTLQRLLEMLKSNEQHVNQIYVDSEAIGSILEISIESVQKQYPQLTEETKECLLETVTKYHAGESYHLPPFSGNIKTNFMKFLLAVALNLLNESTDRKVRFGFFSLFGEISRIIGAEVSPFISGFVPKMVESVKQGEFNGSESIVFKEDLINLLTILSQYTGGAFAPYVESCYEAAYSQLDSPEARGTTIKALDEFVAAFRRAKQAHRVREIAPDIIPKLAGILKTDVTPSVADSIRKCFDRLLCDATVFNGNVQLFKEALSCMPWMAHEAKSICRKLGTALCTLGIGKFCKVVLPVPDAESPMWNEIRRSIYEILSIRCEHELKTATPGLYTYDLLFPTLLSGMRDKNERVQSAAIKAMAALILKAGDNAIKSHREIRQEFTGILSNENCAHCVVSATYDAIGRLITAGSKFVSVDKFLYSIILIGFRKSMSCEYPPAEIAKFLKICCGKIGYLIDRAVAELPDATKILEYL